MIEFVSLTLLARRTLLMAGVLAASCGALWAQPDGPMGPPPDGSPPGEMQQQQRGPNVERELKQLTLLLTLTAEQQAQVKAILTDQHQQIEALFKQSKPVSQSAKTTPDNSSDDDPQARMEAMASARAAAKAIRKDAHAKIAALLNDPQKEKFAAWQKRQDKAAEQQSNEMPPPPPDGADGPPPDGGGPDGGGPPGN
ncbi:MAG: Spy/CpxP family protein refolding chaperone [Terracidiphilus sp.]|jgi:Spy/CpxP family protein refolding chaperone